MRLVDADKILEKLETGLDNPEEFPVMGLGAIMRLINNEPEVQSAQPEYEPVTAEDFAKTMSENTIYSFMAWHGMALALVERQGFVICKKTM